MNNFSLPPSSLHLNSRSIMLLQILMNPLLRHRTSSSLYPPKILWQLVTIFNGGGAYEKNDHFLLLNLWLKSSRSLNFLCYENQQMVSLNCSLHIFHDSVCLWLFNCFLYGNYSMLLIISAMLPCMLSTSTVSCWAETTRDTDSSRHTKESERNVMMMFCLIFSFFSVIQFAFIRVAAWTITTRSLFSVVKSDLEAITLSR